MSLGLASSDSKHRNHFHRNAVHTRELARLVPLATKMEEVIVAEEKIVALTRILGMASLQG